MKRSKFVVSPRANTAYRVLLTPISQKAMDAARAALDKAKKRP